MSDRPTPEQIAASHLSLHRRGNPSMSGPNKRDGERAATMLAHFRAAGFVVVHPDDVPTPGAPDEVGQPAAAYRSGWNACRRVVFRETDS